jgi:sugar lactone lactonase YvrE
MSAQLNNPQSVAFDAESNLLIGEDGAIRTVDRNGIITTIAGTGEPGYSGDHGLAISAQLSQIPILATDATHNVYIGDSFNLCIRKVDPGGSITTVAGGRSYDSPSGDGGPATSARLMLGGLDPGTMGVSAADTSGNLFIADTGNNRIRKVDTNGLITTIAGNGSRGFSGDSGSATEAQLGIPIGVAVDESGNVFIADWGNNRVRKVSTDGIITTVAGDGPAAVQPYDGPLGDGGPAVRARLGGPTGVAVDRAGNLFIADSNNWCIRKVSADEIITTWAGGGDLGGTASDGHPATEAKLYWQTGGLAVDSLGSLYIATYGDGSIHKVDANGTITTVGRGYSDAWSSGVTVDSNGTIYVAQTSDERDGDERILKLSVDGTVTTIAGRGPAGYAGDDGPATDGQLSGPAGLSVDRSGNIYFCRYRQQYSARPSACLRLPPDRSTDLISIDFGVPSLKTCSV